MVQKVSLRKMGSKNKCKPQIFPFLTLTTALVFLVMNYVHFTMNYARHLQNEFQSMTTYLKTLRNPEWFEVVSREKKIKVGLIKMEQQQQHIKDSIIRQRRKEYSKTVKKNPGWFDVVTREMKRETFKIGLVNADSIVHTIHTNAHMVRVDFEPVGDELKWSDLAPERIEENSTCPNIPMPRFEEYRDLDIIIAGVLNCENGGVRDVFRLQVNLIVANLLVTSSNSNRSSPVLAVFLDPCGPMWEIFRCDDLLVNKGNVSIYKPDLKRIKLITLVPVGSCRFVPPFSSSGVVEEQAELKLMTSQRRREAYVTLLHTSEHYVCGAIVLAQSIIQSNSTRDLILLVDENISPQSIKGLKAAGWKVKLIERIRSPYSRKDTYNEYNYSKLRIWNLTQYDKLIFIDADFLVNRNMDRFFVYPQLTAAGNYENHLFNSGLMFVEPSECTYKTLMEKMLVVESYNGGDQGFLNEMFAWWHRLPPQLNYLKVFVDPKDHLHWINDQVYAVHYTGLKPWKCYRQKDCNWDEAVWNRYASSSAHRMWWKVYRAMPKELRPFCVHLTPEEDQILENNIWVEDINATSRVRALRDKVREITNSTSEHPTADNSS